MRAPTGAPTAAVAPGRPDRNRRARPGTDKTRGGHPDEEQSRRTSSDAFHLPSSRRPHRRGRRGRARCRAERWLRAGDHRQRQRRFGLRTGTACPVPQDTRRTGRHRDRGAQRADRGPAAAGSGESRRDHGHRRPDQGRDGGIREPRQPFGRAVPSGDRRGRHRRGILPRLRPRGPCLARDGAREVRPQGIDLAGRYRPGDLGSGAARRGAAHPDLRNLHSGDGRNAHRQAAPRRRPRRQNPLGGRFRPGRARLFRRAVAHPGRPDRVDSAHQPAAAGAPDRQPDAARSGQPAAAAWQCHRDHPDARRQSGRRHPAGRHHHRLCAASDPGRPQCRGAGRSRAHPGRGRQLRRSLPRRQGPSRRPADARDADAGPVARRYRARDRHARRQRGVDQCRARQRAGVPDALRPLRDPVGGCGRACRSR